MNQTIIIRPLITEKSLTKANAGWYSFAVAIAASKEQIAHEITSIYKVTVLAVRTATMHGKTRRTGKKSKRLQLPNWKKACIHIAKDQHIDAFEVGQQQAA